MTLLTKDELIKKLKKYEWNDVEFKSCQKSVSKEVYKTVSAFSNTAGGHIVFGIEDKAGKFSIIGVSELDKVQGEFLSCLRSGSKLGKAIDVKEDIIEINGKSLLVFYIPEAPRQLKPIYLNKDISQSYKRSGSSDHKCSLKEIENYLRDAADTSFDNQPLSNYDAAGFYDPASLKAYRRLYENLNRGKYAELSDPEFLKELGYTLEQDGKMLPNRAGILIFGKAKHILREVPRGIVDFQKINARSEDWTPEQRWDDRLFLEENLFNTFRALMDKYINLSEIPFSLDSSTQMRKDEPIDYTAFREAAVNLLIHQDYGDYARTPSIKLFRDKISFWNPGAAFATLDELIDGKDTQLRNPLIVRAFRQIGFSEQAGTGIRTIMRKCRELGYVPAEIINDKSAVSFTLDIIKQDLISKEQALFQKQMRLKLEHQEVLVFALACQKPQITLIQLKATLLKSSADCQKFAAALVKQKVLEIAQDKQAWKLSKELREKYYLFEKSLPQMGTEQVSEQVGGQVSSQAPEAGNLSPRERTVNKEDTIHSEQAREQAREQAQINDGFLSDIQKQIIMNTFEPVSMQELLKKLNRSGRTSIQVKYMPFLLKCGILLRTFPDTPNHPKQKYYLSEYGKELYQILRGEQI